MKTIKLGSTDLVALVDDEDFEAVIQFVWLARPRSDGKGFYVFRNIRRSAAPRPGYDKQLLHHFLLKPSDGRKVDHKDGDGLNNQRYNLREATQRQNACNQKKQFGTRSSKYKGVIRANLIHGKYQGKKPWRARIRVNGKLIELGHFREEVDAATAYNFAAEEHFGEFARFNVPL